MPRLILATTASDTPMGAQRYEREVIEGARSVLPGWTVDEAVARSVRSRLPGNRRLPMSWLQGASASQRRWVGRVIYSVAPAIVHRMDLVLPPGPSADVVTIHDTVAWRYPDESAPIAAAAEEARRSSAVICVSEFSANEVQRLLGVASPIVVYNGVDERFFGPPRLTNDERRSLGLTDPYVLHSGGASQRKNLEALAAAWPLVHQALPHLTLALSGPAHERRTRLFAGLPGIRLLGRLPESIMPSLVGSAVAVVVPSTYEGFGLPALEAMAAGVPVVAADTSALPEVIGDSGLLVSPTGSGIADGIMDVFSSGQDAESLRRRGIERAREFTWQRCAAQHAEVWRSVV